MKKYRRTQNNVGHFNRISERVIYHENPVSSRQIVTGENAIRNIRTETSDDTTATDVVEKGTAINLSEIIRNVD